MNPAINLATHVGDVVTQVETSGFDRFVLVGHSYGGVIITGVAAILGARIDAMTFPSRETRLGDHQNCVG